MREASLHHRHPILMAAAVFIITAMISALSSVLFQVHSASAISGWNAGNIIDDGVFINKNSMSPQAIQSFLQSKVPTCDTWGTQPSEFGGGTRRQWAESRGYSAPFTCLKDYSENGKSASQIIYDVSQEFSINPQVLIVLLQKEQSLVTDTWPLSVQYRTATGYGCPDTAPCDSQYYGLTNQLTWAARMFRAIMNNSPTWYTPYVLGNNYIQYNPDAGCGGSTVNIQNRSTQALYNYTPYQPNQGALNAGWGTAPCGAYGNRNFYLYFINWFGTVRANFDPMSSPRWMQLSTSTRKINPSTGQAVDDVLPQGTQIKFVSKIETGQGTCLRTANDTNLSLHKCILMPSLTELQIAYTPVSGAEALQRTNTSTYKQTLRYNKDITAFPLAGSQQIQLGAKTTIGGKTYYVTAFDYANGQENGISEDKLEPSNTYSAVSPLWYRLKDDSTKINPLQNTQIDSSDPKGSIIKFTSRTQINSALYYRTEHDSNKSLDKAFPQSALESPFDAFKEPRYMKIKNDTQAVNPFTGATTGDSYTKGQLIRFTTKVSFGNGEFYRSEANTANDSLSVLPSSAVEEVSYAALPQAKWMRLNQNTNKLRPATGVADTSITFPSGQDVRIAQSITIGGTLYYRTAHDVSTGNDLAIPASHFSEISYSPFQTPRTMELKQSTTKFDPITGVAVGPTHAAGTRIRFETKITVNGIDFYRSQHDTLNNLNTAIRADLLREL